MSVQYLSYTLKNGMPVSTAIPATPWNMIDKNLITIPIRHWEFLMEDIRQELPDEVDWVEDYFMERDEHSFEYPHDPELKHKMINTIQFIIEHLEKRDDNYFLKYEYQVDLNPMGVSDYTSFLKGIQIVFREALEKNTEVVAEIY